MKTRPTTEQIRFRSTKTGEHILDTYMEAVEKGNRTLADLLDDLFDNDTGLFRADIFEFRFNNDSLLEFRVGDFPNATTGWRLVPNGVNPQAQALAAQLAQQGAEAARDTALTYRDQANTHRQDSQAASTASQLARDQAAIHKDDSQAASTASQAARIGSEAARDLAQGYRDDALIAKNAVEAIYGPSGSGAIVQLGRRALPDDGMSMVLGRRF